MVGVTEDISPHSRGDELRNGGPLLASAAIGLTTGMTATMFYSLGAFIPSLQAEFGWSRGEISFGVSLLTVALFVAGPWAGRLSDRYGAARIGALSLSAYALATLLLAHTVTRIEVFWIGYFVIAILGAGSTPIVLLRPISAAFHRSRGIAMGIALTGAGIAGYGWQYSIFALGYGFSPFLVGVSRDWSGSYTLALLGSAALAPLAAVLASQLSERAPYGPGTSITAPTLPGPFKQ